MRKHFSESDHDGIRELLMGRKVTSVLIEPNQSGAHTGYMVLDNGLILRVDPNQGGCICGAGDYDVTSLERVDNIITHVDFDIEHHDEYEEATAYRIFVLAGHERINLLTVEGDDGNGYYGTGYDLSVVIMEENE